MPDYKKLYHIMFNAATDAERLATESAEILRKAQQECEKLYIESDDTPLALLEKQKDNFRHKNAHCLKQRADCAQSSSQ